MAQPCEWCGRTRASGWNSKRQDYYMKARSGSKAAIRGFEFERLCGKCFLISEIHKWWEIDPPRGIKLT